MATNRPTAPPTGAEELATTEVLHIAPKADDLKDGPAITAGLLEAMERELQAKLELAGDVAPRLLYQLADVRPDHLDAFVRHHAQHFSRRMVQPGAQAEEVAAVLFRHAFVVGVLAERATKVRR